MFFTYSERPNTEAVDLGGVVPKKIRAKRSKMLRGLSAKKRRSFYESQLGNSLTALFERRKQEGLYTWFYRKLCKSKICLEPRTS